MAHKVTKGIVLHRINYGEADKIITMLTPQSGKITLMAKGVRKPKSKLAGGIELFSVSDITYMEGRKDIHTLTSARLEKHYENIIKDIDRTMLGYDMVKQLHRATEQSVESEYYVLLEQALEALDHLEVDRTLIQVWFSSQLLRLAGHAPNLRTDTEGNSLSVDVTYDFSFDDMTFVPSKSARFNTDTIKVLRLLFGDNKPATLQKVQGVDTVCGQLMSFVQNMQRIYLAT